MTSCSQEVRQIIEGLPGRTVNERSQGKREQGDIKFEQRKRPRTSPEQKKKMTNLRVSEFRKQIKSVNDAQNHLAEVEM